MKGLKGKKALVTGASSGIGQAIAFRLAEEGVDVAINYIGPPTDAVATRDKIDAAMTGTRPLIVEADVSDAEAVERMFAQVTDEYGSVDILINNAGFQIGAPSDELAIDDFDRVIAVNLRGSFLCAQHALRGWLAAEKPGCIVNISSIHQVIPKPGYIGYSTSKGGIQNLTRTLALEYGARGIRVNGVGPGATATPMNMAWINDPAKRAAVEAHIPLRRPGGSDEMAAATAFLASDEAAYITGQTLFVDGGLTLYADFEYAWSTD
jgi:glucose 1-dehydrogenase